jgi:uncharacterized membrane protein
MTDPRSIRVAVMLLAIFVAGGFCGWWIGRATPPREPAPTPERGARSAVAQKELMLDEFTRRLALNETQRVRISVVMDEWAEEVRKADLAHLTNKETIFGKYSPLLRTNLNDDQRDIFDRMTAQMERRRERMMRTR